MSIRTITTYGSLASVAISLAVLVDSFFFGGGGGGASGRGIAGAGFTLASLPNQFLILLNIYIP
jgi:hypothetical protein